MSASKGIVFSIEAALAVIILLSVFVVLYTIPSHMHPPDMRMQQAMIVAHDLIVNDSGTLPEGYATGYSCINSNEVTRLTISQYNNWHAEVCMP